MKKIIYIFLAVIVIFAGMILFEIIQHFGEITDDNRIVIRSPHNEITEDTRGQISRPHVFVEVDNIEDWIANVSKVKFHENMTPERTTSCEFIPFDMTELFVPDISKEDFELRGIWAYRMNHMEFSYSHSDTGDNIRITWSRHFGSDVTADEAILAGARGGGHISSEIVLHDEISYGIFKFRSVIDDTYNYSLSWVQYGRRFSASIPAHFTRYDIFEIARMRRVETWELDGDAVSVSIQGMENVRIFEQSVNGEGVEVTEPIVVGDAIYNATSRRDDRVRIGDALYRAGQGGTMERVGYRWLIDEELGRYQYVLMPGMYTFRADGIVGTPGLTIRHFESGDAVSVADYTAELSGQSFSAFSITVTPYGSSLNIYQ